jgi:NAD(P)H-dependent flavin oxidoreductase YrpB (nitropropane dioxygenase family)
MTSPLSNLGLVIPVIAAPMSGGPTTPAMVVAAAHAGGLGFLAAGYKTPDAIEAEISAVRDASIPFGVNVFAPNSVPVSLEDYREYASALQREADRFGLTLAHDPVENDDYFDAKIDLLVSDPVPIVSFTFGVPGRNVIGALQTAGTVVVQTVTSRQEAEVAAAAGVDMLAVQASPRETFGDADPTERPRASASLIWSQIGQCAIPVAAVKRHVPPTTLRVIHAGAEAAMVGTVLMRADESGTSATHQAALADPSRTETVITRAFTGRPARGLRNGFIDTYESRALLGFPAIHHLTSPLRKAAAAAGQPDLVHLWAGTGYRHARREPTATILSRLAGTSIHAGSKVRSGNV